jgi:hypothetical protein
MGQSNKSFFVKFTSPRVFAADRHFHPTLIFNGKTQESSTNARLEENDVLNTKKAYNNSVSE